MSDDTKRISSMADLLKTGATLTDLSCPACSSPLFRLKNEEIWCAECKKKVIVIKDDDQIETTENIAVLNIIESTLLLKLQDLNKRIMNNKETEELQKLSTLLNSLLENLIKIRKLSKY